jgi:hypothetical protein
VKNESERSTEKTIPINVKVIDMPVTIAIGRSRLPTEPDNTAGNIGRTHGVITVAMPAMNTMITDGADVGIN